MDINKKFDISNISYELISSSDPKLKEVQVLFNYQGKKEKYFIFIEDTGNKDYINEAKKIFKRDLESGKVAKSLNITLGRKHPILITSISVVAAAAIAVAGYFTYKYLNSEPAPAPTVSHKFTFNGDCCMINGQYTYTHDIFESDKNVQYTITPEEGYKLPATVEGGVSYNPATGVITISEIKEDVTVTAKGIALPPQPGVTHTVHFNPNGGKIEDDIDVIEGVVDGDLIDKPKLLDRAGYKKENVKWYKTYNFEPSSEFDFTQGVKSDLCLHAKWGDIEKCKVSFYEDDTDTPKVKEVEYGSKPVYYTPDNPVGHEDDSFLGWYVSRDEGASQFNFDQAITDNTKNAYAHWKKPGYVVMWVDHDGTILETDTGLKLGDIPHYDGDEPAPYIEVPYIYKFSGWSPNTVDDPIDGDRIYFAQFDDKVMIEGDVLMSFNIPTGGKTVSLKFEASESLKFNWGDDSSEETTQPGQEEIEHFYADGGRYILVITGNITNISIHLNTYDDAEILTSLYLGDTISSIPPYAFTNCSNLETIIVADNNPVYDSRNNCNAIIETYTNTLMVGCKNTIIPDTVATIFNVAFYGCSGLTSINIPKSVKSIYYSAFANCSGLETITVDLNNSTYDSREDCNAIIETASNTLIVGCKGTTIPDGVVAIGDRAFMGCSGLNNINIPESVTSINDYAFINCSNLETIIVADNNPVYDSRNNCNAIIETASNTLIVGCKGTTIPDGVVAIGDTAFTGCSGLTNINIPNSITSIPISEHIDPFYDCSNLETITVGDNNPVYDSRNNCNAIIETASKTLIVGCKGTTIPDSVTTIGESAFRSRLGRAAINIPANVTEIKSEAFTENFDLISATISNGVIRDYAFSRCLNLSYVQISNGVTSIGFGSFQECSNLSVVDLTKFNEDNIPECCGSEAFQRCSSDLKFYVAPGMKEKFVAAEGWDEYDSSYFVETNDPPTPPVC